MSVPPSPPADPPLDPPAGPALAQPVQHHDDDGVAQVLEALLAADDAL